MRTSVDPPDAPDAAPLTAEKSPRVAPAWAPVAAATALLVLLEAGGLSYRMALPVDALGVAAWAGATAALIASVLLLLDLPMGLFDGLFARAAESRLGRPLALIAFMFALAAFVADLALYARLYPGYHALLGLGALTAALKAMRLLVRRIGPVARPRRAVSFGVAIALIGAAHGLLAWREDARGALRAQGVLGADLGYVWSALSDVDGDGDGFLLGGSD
ncbi:MAG: hypothetical protein KC620_24250, partial [Myxococcales bacterium]|nr:hypothetical protein [Myxococcales bacterium]